MKPSPLERQDQPSHEGFWRRELQASLGGLGLFIWDPSCHDGSYQFGPSAESDSLKPV